MSRAILAIVGYGSTGKDTVARYIVKKYDFVHISSSDLIRQYMTNKGITEHTRELTQHNGNEMRALFGPDVLVRHALEAQGGRIIVSGLRALPEAQAIISAGGHILAVEAPPEVRFGWAQARGGAKDRTTLEAFLETEKLERANPNSNAQNLAKVMTMAELTVLNDGTEADLYAKIDAAMASIFNMVQLQHANS